jgi:hypothetical protein
VLEVGRPADLADLDCYLQTRGRRCSLLESLQAPLTDLLAKLGWPAIEKTNRKVNKTLIRRTVANQKVSKLSPSALAVADSNTCLCSEKCMHL